ncbi:MAG: nickel pincer cofactor biosynthesis protein LarC [Acidimicrobiales bacterium]
MTTVAWWNCFAGIAGNMALGALVDAGADLESIEAELAKLELSDWEIRSEQVLRAGIAATYLDVVVEAGPQTRTYTSIVAMLERADLPGRVRGRALAVFDRLGRAESRLHRVPLGEVHFHEVGSTDAIVDVVGTCIALELLGVDEVFSGPVAQGSGMASSAHGSLPVPAPAVSVVLAEVGAPIYGTGVRMELTTPTGAALLAGLCNGWGPVPAMNLVACGFGAGTRDIDGLPNATQVLIGEVHAGEGPDLEGAQPLVVMEATVDDVTGEILASTISALLRRGALDAWVSPVTGKKGRPAHVLTVLSDPSNVSKLRAVITSETGTLGVRASTWRRWPSARNFVTVEVSGLPVRVKVSAQRYKAEHDDALGVAAQIGRPVRDVACEAEEAARTTPL